ncbi:MAG: Bcr/CflA family drug resistance efflux transporter [Bacteriovorax sp. MedPE-SWde]|nr:MAG: Bcr/CflA family drug resistance efflux transporter [Bacteriovorax sp. MedPE-SWde]
MNKDNNQLNQREFVALMALLMSLVALSIDAMLPALNQIGTSLGVANKNDSQLIISTVFLGMSFGLMLYGPLSDSFGRKKSIYLGVSIFIVGSFLSMLATNFTMMLVGRFLQGFGAASCRVVSVAMIRDQFSGREMGKIMSLIMIVFVMVPALAPSLGQLILIFSQWRTIFGVLIILGALGIIWLWKRQPETLLIENRVKFSFKTIFAGAKETLAHPTARGYTLAAGLGFGAFVGYLSSAQQILQGQYKVGDSFALYFGCLALAIGLSSFINSKLVMKLGMERLCKYALSLITLLSGAFYTFLFMTSGHPPLSFLIIYLALTFLCIGILFGNLNTLAVGPLGHIAGVANSVISSVQTLISVGFGALIGLSYDGTVIPLVQGFFFLGIASLLIVIFTQRDIIKVPNT